MTDSSNQGILDTSTVILLGQISDAAELPDDAVISAITLAELSVGPHVANDDAERGARQQHLQQAESDFDVLPFDGNCARAFGGVAAALRASGSKEAARAYDAHRSERNRLCGAALYLQSSRLLRNPTTRGPISHAPAPSIVGQPAPTAE